MSRISTSQNGKQCAVKRGILGKNQKQVWGPYEFGISALEGNGQWETKLSQWVGVLEKEAQPPYLGEHRCCSWLVSMQEGKSKPATRLMGFFSILPCLILHKCVCLVPENQGPSGRTVCRVKHTMCRFLEAASGSQKLLRRRDTLLWLRE